MTNIISDLQLEALERAGNSENFLELIHLIFSDITKININDENSEQIY